MRLPLLRLDRAVKVFQDASVEQRRQQEALTGKLMASTGGRWLVGLAGLVVAGIGVGLVIYGVTKRFEKHLKTGEMSPTTRTAGPPARHGRLHRQGRRVRRSPAC